MNRTPLRAHAVPLLLVVLAVAGCSSVRTRYDYDPDTDFTAWQTYGWYEAGPEALAPDDPRLSNPLLHGRIVAAVDRALADRGFTLAEPGASPDFFVQTHLSLGRRLDVRTINRGYHRGSAGRGWGTSGWGGVTWSETRVNEVEEGTLLVDLLDVEARQLAWRGTGTRRLPRNLTGDRLTRAVNEAVDEILRRFPPGS